MQKKIAKQYTGRPIPNYNEYWNTNSSTRYNFI